MGRISVLLLGTVILAPLTTGAVRQQPKEDGFISLFDGKSFRGWYAADMSWWSIRDEAITGTITQEKPCRKNQYIFYEPHKPEDAGLPLYQERGRMANHELKITHRILSPNKVNGGFQYRSEHYQDGDCKGYQIDNNTKTPWLVRMYDEFGRHTLAWRGERAWFEESGRRHVRPIEAVPPQAHFKLEEWHEYHLICRGTQMTLSVDGQLVAEVFDGQPSAADLTGLLAPQLHSGPPMVVQFKNILFKPLPPGQPPTPPLPGPPAATEPGSADKTLVSWVNVSDKALRGGSVLTVQEGDRFDGIVFAELAPARWMAGSDHFRRTQRNQGDYAEEKADAGTLVQLALVYKGDRILLYRNAELYASHRAENIDLLDSKRSIVVFGLRHIGGNGAFGGSIDDARIYRQALSAGEIKSLAPNKASSIRPYAWWDFEGEKVVEREGRYPHFKMGGRAKLADGKLVLGRNAVVVAGRSPESISSVDVPFAGPYVPETPAWPGNPPDNWAIYHLAHPTFTQGSPFDPNAALFHKGRYHLHYIYRNATGFVFAHVSSPDMVHWKWHPTVLAPPTTGHGMFSGTGFFTRDGRPAIVYHGEGSGRNWIQYAQDDDLDQWSEPQVMLPRDKDGRLMENVPYFDPDIWRMGDTFYGLNGISSSSPPQIMKSDNLKDWTFIGELLHPDFDEKKLGVKRSEDISCPNMFRLGDKWVLLCISHRLGCRYFIGDFKDDQYLPEHHALLGGNSNRYFAPESLLTPDGRRVNWTWFFGGETRGVQSLPTELELPADGILRLRPIRELESLRYGEQRLENVTVKKDTPMILEKIRGEHLELEVVVHNPAAAGFGIDVLCDERGKPGLRINVNREKNLLEVGDEKAPFEQKKGEALTLRIFVDTTLVEVFANERQVVMNDRRRAAGARINDRVAVFSLGQDLRIEKITAWKMKTCF